MREKVFYENDPELNVIYLLNEHADRTPTFNTKFLDGCERMLTQNGYLSEKQVLVLNEIYSKIKK
jgi:hypothetical protein